MSILPTLVLSILPTLVVSILSTLVVSILPTLVVLPTLVESILPTLVVSARAATGWLVGSCRPHVARDGARTTISQKMITIIHEKHFPENDNNILPSTPGIKYGTLFFFS